MRFCPICGDPFDSPHQTCSRLCGQRLRQITVTRPERQAWLKRYYLQRQALREFPRGLLQRVPARTATMYLLMQRERGER